MSDNNGRPRPQAPPATATELAQEAVAARLAEAERAGSGALARITVGEAAALLAHAKLRAHLEALAHEALAAALAKLEAMGVDPAAVEDIAVRVPVDCLKADVTLILCRIPPGGPRRRQDRP